MLSWDYMMLYGHYGYIHGKYVNTAVTTKLHSNYVFTWLPWSNLVTMVTCYQPISPILVPHVEAHISLTFLSNHPLSRQNLFVKNSEKSNFISMKNTKPQRSSKILTNFISVK